MGRFTYEASQRVAVDDRALHHLQVVITTKLRRGEPFTFTWREDLSVGGGRIAVWLHPGSNLVFAYAGHAAHDLNRDWVKTLAYTANAPSGLYLVHEPDRAPSP